MSALNAIDYEIEKLRQDIPKYQASANKVAFRKGERDLHADRVVEWGEHRLAQLESARAAIAELIEAVKTQRAIADSPEHWHAPGVREGFAALVGLDPYATRIAITERADANVASALAAVGPK